jgi:hypothetical protein
MECTLVVPHGTDMSKFRQEYPDITLDDVDEDGDVYFIGKPSDEKDEDDEDLGEWLTYDEAIEFCGFSEGAIPSADAVIDGNGEWAMGMLSRKDFSGLAIDDVAKAEHMRRSSLWHEAFDRGKLVR